MDSTKRLHWMMNLVGKNVGLDSPNYTDLNYNPATDYIESKICRDDIYELSGGMTRAQLTFNDACLRGKVSTFEFTMRPRNWDAAQGPVTFFTYHSNPDTPTAGVTGPVDLQIYKGQLRVMISGPDGNKVSTFLKHIDLDGYTHIKVKFLDDYTGENGFVQLFIGGQMYHCYTGPVGYDQQTPCFAKLGVYKWPEAWASTPENINTCQINFKDVQYWRGDE